ncbi:RiPP maturation radical SAM C-methyltransferase [Actinoallomurus sp. NBC_01490]|uniref:RiPP maturation radical SAM C-methyltransferase n=1 Tax=Actinoallomurus sp. NBC_01490 TaxID=2903557 RepID=UPI002E36295E|nr:RiPP maturation radical SAM C-methyltransferase [Actinoallomurus sp. NBC_01490]
MENVADRVALLEEIEEYVGSDRARSMSTAPPLTSLDITLEKIHAAPESPRVALVVMPWADIRWASIGVSILQSALDADRIPCDVIYPNLDLAEAVGARVYNRIGAATPKTSLAGDWIFGPAPNDIDAAERYLAEVLLAEHADFFDFATIFEMGEVRAIGAKFLDDVAAHDVWEHYDIVGMTSTFQQNMPVVGLAERLKRRRPEVTTIMGGGNCEGPMGRALLESFPAIDYVFQGDAESSISRFVRDLRTADDRRTWLNDHSYWSERAELTTDGRAVIRSDSMPNMDDIPQPTYHDFYARLQRRLEGSDLPADTAIPIEMSRGCWWGEKKHCTFCGLNGLTMSFRSKSADRAFLELADLVERHGADPRRRTYVLVVDNILDYRYFNDLLPMIAESDLRVTLHFEVKSNLRYDQLELLRAAGVLHLQPGIESMSDHLLETMRKGTTRLRNIQTMKWSTELGIGVSWNYLHGFPGESDDDYRELPELFSLISHLPPPEHVGPARADRFSPFQQTPEIFGIRRLTHERAYDHIYFETPADRRSDIAYFFRMEHGKSLASDFVLDKVRQSAARWSAAHRDARLEATWTDDGLMVRDERAMWSGPSGMTKLGREESSVLIAVDQMRSLRAIERALPFPVPGERTAKILEELVERGLVIENGGTYLGLPILNRRNLPQASSSRVRHALPLVQST